MRFLHLLFLFFLIVPFAEIYLLLTVGGIIGPFPTIAMVVFTAVLGAWLFRQQGFQTLRRFQESLAQGNIPTYEIVEGPILLIGAALLLTPGFITDLLGFICLIPALRRKVAQYIIEKHLIQAVQAGSPFRPRGAAHKDALEGEYRKED